MNQLKIEQAKYKRPSKNTIEQSKSKSNKSYSLHSEMIRLGLTLLLVIFIYKSVSSSEINYQQIVQNQKMFVVKDVRGVFPPLNGTSLSLIDKWKIVYFQSHANTMWNKFENYTFQFSKELLNVSKEGCRSTLQFNWFNLSYNMDLRLNQKQGQIIQTAQNVNQSDQCLKQSDQIVKMLNKTSIWTISGMFLYLLVQNDASELSDSSLIQNQGDFYIILQRSSQLTIGY